MRTHAPLLPYVFALLVCRSDLLLKELDQCLLGFIEQVKSHIVKRKNPLNNLLSLSEEEIIQLKAKPAEGTNTPGFGPSKLLDFELEMAFITTDANNLPDSRYSPTATSANGKIYVIGGYNPPNGEYSSYLVGEATYPSTSSWEVVDYVGPSEWDTHNYRVQRWSYYSKVTGVTVVYPKTTSSIGFFSVANV